MKDRARLESKVAKLGEAGGSRSVTADGADASLRGVLTEVDETILPRRLTFSQGARTFWIDAAKRRIVRMEGVDFDLNELEDAAREMLRDRILAALPSSGQVDIRTDRLTELPSSDDVGASAQNLAAAWGIDLNAPAVTDARNFPQAVSFLTEHSVGYLERQAGAVKGTAGDTKWTDKLQKIGEDERAQLRMLASGGSSASTVILQVGTASGNEVLLFASSEDREILAVLPRAKLSDLGAVLYGR
jgi:hypothetical protein